MNTKICYDCKKEKPISEYTKDNSKKDGYAIQCKLCCKAIRLKYKEVRKKYATEYRKTHKVKDKRTKENRFKRKYGIDISVKHEIIKKQNEKCAICNKPFDLNKPSDIHIDHNHKNKKIRGVLCKYCNLLIGFSKEDTKILERAIGYLNFWNK